MIRHHVTITAKKKMIKTSVRGVDGRWEGSEVHNLDFGRYL